MDDGKNERSISIFCSYAHEDEDFTKELVKHLSRNHINIWYDERIDAGKEWEKEIDERLNNADIILLLVSVDFMNSDYCSKIEMKRAMERYDFNKTCVLPIILRPVHWKDTDLGRLKVLPKDGEPLSKWKDREEAFYSISVEIIHNANKILKNQYNDDAKRYLNAGKKEAACESCHLALAIPYIEANLDKELGDRLHELGHILQESRNFKKALEAYESAMRDENKDVSLYLSILLEKGKVHFKLKEYFEAFFAYKEAIATFEKSSPVFKDKGELYENMGNVLIELEKPDEALNAYQHAKNVFNSEKEKRIAISREIARACFKWADIKQNEGLEEFDSLIKLWPEAFLKRNKANMVASFGQLEKALELYTEAIEEFPNDAFLFKERGDTFLKLNRLTDALDDYNRAIHVNSDYEKAKKRKNEVLTSLVKEQARIAEILRREERDDNPG